MPGPADGLQPTRSPDRPANKLKTMHTTNGKACFAPELSLRVVAPAVEFYQKGFGAEVLLLVKNADGSIHVAELQVQGAVFHLHQEMPGSVARGPESVGATTVSLGLF